jgi:hypothetical protein
LFAAAAFTGAALLFVVQPLIARLLLPSYGGSATVWSTSSLFFQVLLLLGYLYAHWSTKRFGTWQPRAHLIVLLAPLVVLPLALPDDAAPGSDASPALWLLRTLALVIGLPFLVVSTTGPLLQKWYSWTDSHRADDPYFLFAASNLGSFGGLLAYPFLIEPTMTLDQQQRWWSIAFVGYLLVTAACGLLATLRFRMSANTPGPADGTEPLARGRIARWLAWSFLPSAFMLAVTVHVTTDVAAMPLLWVIPLAIYLATFVVAFARSSRVVPVRATQVAVALGLVAATSGSLAGPASAVVPKVVVQMLALAAVGYAAHARLAADRPPPAHLTTFYLVVSIGGALGGLLNGLVAPAVFDRVLEYPLVLAAVPLLMLGLVADGSSWVDRLANRSLLWAAILVTLAVAGVGGLALGLVGDGSPHLASWLCLLVLVLALGYRMAEEAVVLIVTLMLVFGVPMAIRQIEMLDQSRTFFGSYQVFERDGRHWFMHGTTVHGTQFRDERSTEPTTYYSRGGPLGDVFDARPFEEVGAIGLGAGAIAAYGQPGMNLTYYEIDPEVVRIARDPGLFSYLSDSAADIDVVVGDGRLGVAREPKGKFDLLVLDAFSSDAIPVHLLTVEAMRTYAERTADDGVLAVHISNNAFDLEPVVAGAAADLGWAGASLMGGGGDGASLSHWVVMSPSHDFVSSLVDKGWSRLDSKTETWTDDYSSILSVLR